MIAIDTNLMVYAHRRDSGWHQQAADAVRSLAEGGAPWAIPWPCVHEFLAIATHPRIYDPPSTLTQALAQMDAWLESPTATLLAETRAYWEDLTAFLRAGRVTGAQVHDARVAALCRHHGVSVLWTADRDFSRFRGLATHNPLIGT